MKVITINIPIQYIKTIASLVGNDKLYCSRSELIRTAIRDFLKKEINLIKELKLVGPVVKVKEVKKEKKVEGFVNVPLHDGSMEHKTYQIIQR